MRFSDIPIRGKLILVFAVIGMVPLLVVGFFGNRLFSQALLEKSFDKVVTIQTLRKKEVERSFKRFFDDLKTLSTSQGLSTLVDDFDHYRHQAEIPATSSFATDTEQFAALLKKYQTSYLEYLETFGYHDLKVISALTGQVMFTVAGERDLGANLIHGRYKESSLAAVWREVVNTGKAAVADFSGYEPAGGVQSLLVGAPVFNTSGTMVSVLVLQLTPGFIDTIMDAREGMGETGESYLIRWFEETGRFEFRSNMESMGSGRYVVGFELERMPQYWKDATEASFKGRHDLYVDSTGKEVLVAYCRLNIPGIKWYQISKIDKSEVLAPLHQLLYQGVLITGVLFVLIFFLALTFSRRLVRPIIADVEFAKAIASGNLDASLALQQKDELGVLAETLNAMAGRLKETDWLKRGKEGLDDRLRGETDLKALGSKLISYITERLDAQLGAFYLHHEGTLELVASHAFTDRHGIFNQINLGEGLVGQATLERRTVVFENIREDVPEYNFGVDQQAPRFFLVAPFTIEGEIIGTFLVGAFHPFGRSRRRFIEENLENVAIFVNMAKSRQTIQQLYERSREQQNELLVANKGLEARTRALKESEAELQAQQEELRVINEELQERTESLQSSQGELQTQQEELRVTNEELLERTETLEKQKAALRQNTAQLVKARKEIEKKAEELELGSKYKSEFLANMSHELRTPLNSILILSQILAANKTSNLDPKQIESAKAIHASGSELLALINEILDLSKVEAGRLELYIEEVRLLDLIADVKRVFKDVADHKGLSFDITLDPDIPLVITTDSQRVQQILRNLLTNAFKFTHHGGVCLAISRPSPAIALTRGEAGNLVAFAVRDDGIGIPEARREAIFKAFQQADGSTNRTYGGTGLGLSISKELTRLLGGTIHVESRVGEGSIFTFILPEKLVAAPAAEAAASAVIVDAAPGDRPDQAAVSANKTLPVIEHDIKKVDEALGKINRIIDKSVSRLLVVEDDILQAESIRTLVGSGAVSTTLVSTGREAMAELESGEYDCLILDLGLADMTGFELLDRIRASEVCAKVPVIVYTGRDLTRREEEKLRKYSESIIIKGVRSPERLLDELAIFLHRVEKNLPARDAARSPAGQRQDEVFQGKSILVVDDDMRNVFALTNLLEEIGVRIIVARDGLESLEKIDKNSDIDLVLMDIMMPKMDGFEAIRRIREKPEFQDLPIIALTAKAMKGDRAQCIEAGANDYLAKPVNTERLLSILKVWLY
jgi:signal transduction histidine kinase/DNA-binding response OmpR family regulator/HAMP domain-containing protein